MDREKVIKAVEEAFDLVHSDYIGTYDFDETEWEQNKADALSMLKEQKAVQPKWTSIKERYPEKEGFYLVSAEHGNYHPWIAEMRIFAGVKGFCNGAAMPVVGAWMPLPEPYTKVDKV